VRGVVINNCSSDKPHPPHPWDGEITKYQCMGIMWIVDPLRSTTSGVPHIGATAAELDFESFAFSTQDLPESQSESRLAKQRDAAWESFLAGYREYGEGAADELGLAGQWGDLYRKIKKLKRPLWEGDREALTRESPRQVLQDIIGHALLALDMIERGM
jgi:hypothetical protein